MAKKTIRNFIIDSTCIKCGGVGHIRGAFPPNHKRARRVCPACEGKGETKKQITAEE